MTRAERKAMAESPKYRAGDIIEISTGYVCLPGIKPLKPGKFKIVEFREAAFSGIPHDMVYVFVSTRKNSSYRYAFSQSWVEQNSMLIEA